MRVTYNDEQSDIKTLYAKDNVVVISGEDKATADEADYDLERGTIVLKAMPISFKRAIRSAERGRN